MAHLRLTVTDFDLFSSLDPEKEVESGNPRGYVAACQANAAALRATGIEPQGGWDLFVAGEKWHAEHGAEQPDIVLVHGLHYNVAAGEDGQTQARWSNDEFKSMAAWSLLAQFPDSVIMFLHCDCYLDFPCPPPHLTVNVEPSCGIDNWGMTSQFLPELLCTKAFGKHLSRVFPYLAAPNTTLDVLQVVADSVLQGRKVLQLASNRFQLSLKIVERIRRGKVLHALEPSSVCSGSRHEVRQFFESAEQKIYRFSFSGLQRWGRGRHTPAELCAYWMMGEKCQSNVEGVFEMSEAQSQA